MNYSILFFMVLMAVAAGCGTSSSSETGGNAPAAEETMVQLTPEQLQNALLEIGPAQRRTLRTTLRVGGVVDVPPRSLVSVSFPLGGYLQHTRLLPGTPVRKGEVLAILEDLQYIQLQQDYLSTTARLEYAEAELKRQQALQDGQAGSAKALQQAQAEHRALKVQQKALGEKLRLIGIEPTLLSEDNLSRSVRVLSPIDGFVSAVHANIGKYVTPTDVLFELVNPKDIHLNLKVFEKDVPLLRVGQPVRAYAPDRPQHVHPGAIILISRNIGPDRAVEVHCHFDRYDPSVLPGMHLRAEVGVDLHEAVAVPEAAVVRWENRHFVFVEQAPGAFEMQEVELGVSADGFVQVSPMRADLDLTQARVVLRNAYTLLMKMKNAMEEE
jgi:cobalt-zinc-cadmium efflux system membrane fusion protein